MEFIKYLLPSIIIAILCAVYYYFRNSKFKDEKQEKSTLPIKEENTYNISSINELLKKVENVTGEIRNVDHTQYLIEELIDLKLLEEIQDSFAKAVGVASITVDNDGNALTKASEFTDFCMQLTRGSSEGLKRCQGCDVGGGKLSAKTGKPAVYKCHSGLVDFGVPILIDDIQIGSIIGGQVLTETPDETKFRQIAKELKIDEDEYIAALRKIPIIKPEKIEAAAKMLYLIANTLSNAGLKKKEALEKSINLKESSLEIIKNTSLATNNIIDSITHLSSTIDNQSAIVEQSTCSIEEMVVSLNSIADVSEKRNQISQSLLDRIQSGKRAISETNNSIEKMSENLKAIINEINIINDISSLTGLLSMNASIEAAHAGENGKGFAVVASEIRKLSTNTANNAVSINDSINKNSDLIKQVFESAKNSETAFRNIEEEVLTVIESLSEIASSTNEMAIGSKEIVAGTLSLKDITHIVKDASSEITDKTQDIKTAMDQVKMFFDDYS